MRNLDTFIEGKVNTSIRVNELLVPANSLARSLQRFTEPALFHTEGFGDYHLSKSGSLFKARVGNRFFAFASQHQLNSPSSTYTYDQLCILRSDRRQLISSHRVVFPIECSDFSGDFDCVLFEFTESVDAGKLNRTDWYDLKSDMDRRFIPKPLISCCIGYPSHRNIFDFNRMEFPVAPNAVWGYEDGKKIKGRLCMKPKPDISFDPAGMSGSPVFGIEMRDTTLILFFAGLLTNASRSAFNFIPFPRMRSLVTEVFD